MRLLQFAAAILLGHEGTLQVAGIALELAIGGLQLLRLGPLGIQHPPEIAGIHLQLRLSGAQLLIKFGGSGQGEGVVHMVHDAAMFLAAGSVTTFSLSARLCFRIFWIFSSSSSGLNGFIK